MRMPRKTCLTKNIGITEKRGINPIGFIKNNYFQINLVKAVVLKPVVLYGPENKMWWC